MISLSDQLLLFLSVIAIGISLYLLLVGTPLDISHSHPKQIENASG